MKKAILKNPDQFWGLLIPMIAVSAVIFYVAIFFGDGFDKYSTIMITASFYPILFCLVAFLVAPKFFLAKILMTDEGILCFLFKKQFNFIKWTDIKHIYKGNQHRMHVIYFVINVNSSSHFYIKINKKRMKLFISLCPIQELKEQMQKIKLFF